MRITTATPDDWSAALELALCDLGPCDRSARLAHALNLVAQHVLDPQGIIVARNQAGLRGVQVCVPLAGAGGLCWLPRTRPADAALAEQLVQHGLDWLHSRGTKIAQALVSPADSPGIGPLLRRGFRSITRLNYLDHELIAVPSASQSLISYSTYSPANRALFHGTLLRTYEGSLDCPELNGIRSLDEIIAGHMAQGKFRPEHWWLVYEAERPVGVAMVTEVPDLEAWDMSYLGVVPEARRRGIGRAVTVHALQAAHDARAPRMTLAVDDRNRPARQLYESLGFQSLDCREVYLYFWDVPLPAKGRRSEDGSVT
jgi:mycothiol synthase